ncbi:MAG: Imm53 family immunity protein [Marmoricola sp.]
MALLPRQGIESASLLGFLGSWVLVHHFAKSGTWPDPYGIEPTHGAQFTTIGTDGWRLSIFLDNTELAEAEFEGYNNGSTDPAFRTSCAVADGVFHAECGPRGLTDALDVFALWARRVRRCGPRIPDTFERLDWEDQPAPLKPSGTEPSGPDSASSLAADSWDGDGQVFSALDALQYWYAAQPSPADGDGPRIDISMFDNPGWSIRIDLRGTTLQNRPFKELQDLDRDEDNWITARVVDSRFEAACGPVNLGEAVNLFTGWAPDTEDS